MQFQYVSMFQTKFFSIKNFSSACSICKIIFTSIYPLICFLNKVSNLNVVNGVCLQLFHLFMLLLEVKYISDLDYIKFESSI